MMNTYCVKCGINGNLDFYGCNNRCGEFFHVCVDCLCTMSIYNPIFGHHQVFCLGCLRDKKLEEILKCKNEF